MTDVRDVADILTDPGETGSAGSFRDGDTEDFTPASRSVADQTTQAREILTGEADKPKPKPRTAPEQAPERPDAQPSKPPAEDLRPR